MSVFDKEDTGHRPTYPCVTAGAVRRHWKFRT